jgi:hypothetical protein
MKTRRHVAVLGLGALAVAVLALIPAGTAHAGGLQTNVAPTLVSEGNRTVAVVTATDGRIFYNWWDLGGGGHGWQEVPGGGRTDAAPAAALVNGANYVFITVKGLDGNLYLNQGNVGGAFVGWQRLGFASSVAPAMASSGARSVVVATGGDGQLYYNWWDLGDGGHGWQPISGGPVTRDAPAAALLADTYLELTIHRELPTIDNSVQLSQGLLPGPLGGWASLGGQIDSTPAMSSSYLRTLVAVVHQQQVLYTWWDYGHQYNSWYQIPGTPMYTSTPPGVALVADGSYVFVLARGLDSNLYLNQGTPGGQFVGWALAG